jgi:DNA-binding NtrC family response regulator
MDKTILLVEDDPDLLDFTAELLQRQGYQLFKAIDAENALKILNTSTISLDLLFSDIRLPGEVDGVELAQRAVAARPELKILLASGYDSGFLKQTVKNSFPFLEKPYYPNKLKQTIQTLLEIS